MENKLFLLHHTDEGRVGICCEDDPNPPPDNAIIERMTFNAVIGLYDDIHESLISRRLFDEPADSEMED